MKNNSNYDIRYFLALHLAGINVSRSIDKIISSPYYSMLDKTKIILKNDYTKYLELAEKSQEQLKKDNIIIIHREHNLYPPYLREIASSPLCLLARGNINLLNKKLVSIVGTRNPSFGGLKFTEYISTFLSKHGYCIVSGMAGGIDRVAQNCALVNPGGTIGIIAHGHNHVYPASNFDLFEKSRKTDSNILLLSEYMPSEKPKRYYFPKRNRIISGMSKALIVTEASQKSGALITGNYALDQGREVASITDKYILKNEGGQSLIQSGAFDLQKHFKLVCGTLNEIKFKELSFYLSNSIWGYIRFSGSYNNFSRFLNGQEVV